MKTDLSLYNNTWYNPGHPLKRVLWYIISLLFFQSAFCPFSGLKVFLLKLFGAEIGKGVCIKPWVTIKYPWLLKMGDWVWIGEHAWIDNLAQVRMGNHVCISQGALLLTGNHNFRLPGFDLIVKPITLEDGVWIGAKTVVCPGVTCFSHAVLTVGSIATKNLDGYGIYQGNPAIKVHERIIGNKVSVER